MNRYMVFAGSMYYPIGGMDDFIASYDDYEEAYKLAVEDDSRDIEWYQIYDLATNSTVLEGRRDRSKSKW